MNNLYVHVIGGQQLKWPPGCDTIQEEVKEIE